ncbi:MAG: rRNA methyltransferase [Parachlamydiaceae bacterium]|nr:rRNA methyltransferase [Parachlamydiaceae bacterium]
MSLPPNLKQAIEEELQTSGTNTLAQAREELSDRYRNQKSPYRSSFMSSNTHRLSYLATRMPATYAAVYKALSATHERSTLLSVKSILDVGAGPGTASWVAVELYPEIEKLTLMERDTDLIAIGKRLMANGQHPIFQQAQWMPTNLEQTHSLPEHDLIILSYVIGELSPEVQQKLVSACFAAAKLLIIIEPGTPAGFNRIRNLRTTLLQQNAHMVAPCPHTHECPMKGNNWCHFTARLERSAVHRQVKNADLGYEDEKFSYLAVSKEKLILPEARIILPPLKRSGHIHVTLCTNEGIQEKTVSKRNPEEFRQVKKCDLGDAIV